MDFSFSDVKTSLNRFEKHNFIILNADHQPDMDILEKISQEDLEDEEFDHRVIDCSGSENAPDDSAYMSENYCEERIVNESSMMTEDENFMTTGRSESAIDEEEIEGISRCKAINSSYINLKRNNMLCYSKE